MKTLTSCVNGTLQAFVPSAEQPWNETRALHLLRRLAFGATPSQVQEILKLSPSQAVDFIIDQATSQALLPEPEWAYWTESDYTNLNEEREQQYREWLLTWSTSMIQNGFKEKMELFWSNHFVTQYETYLCTPWLYQYHKVIQENALGNFKSFTKAIGITPAMLVYLNGVQNSRIQPNENYARELYELFTLGRDNGYSQTDIEETARALTGWVGYTSFCGPINFVAFHHDNEQKTIFGQTGNYGYDEVHDLLFEERKEQIAKYICEKLYKAFVQPEPDTLIIEGLAVSFLASDFELAPVLKQLFKSEHFFDDKILGVQIKSPIEYFMQFVKSGEFSYNEEILEGIVYYSFLIGQQLFNPTDVAGWPGDKAWVNNNTITTRWQGLQFFLFYLYESKPEELSTLAFQLVGATTDPALATQVIVDYFLPNGLQRQEDYDRATSVFKHEIPQNYFDENSWNLEWDTVPAQVALLINHIIQLPEFQLQ